MRLERRGSLRTDENGDERCPSAQPIGPSRSTAGPEGAPNASESVQNGRYWLLFGCLEAVTLAMAYVLSNGRPELQCCGRLGSWRTPKCVVR